MHLGALVVWLACPMPLAVKVTGIILICLGFYRTFNIHIRPAVLSADYSLVQSTDRDWVIQKNGKQSGENLILRAWIVRPWLIVLRFVDASKHPLNIILAADSADGETMRRLRICLQNR